ncbi:MAG: phage major capsid protein, partial [Actinomycetota bacterium]|nr:phage major capsid protein [Actinomycetota bacterium]
GRTMSVLENLRAKREEARTAADAILTRASEETRDLTSEESADYQSRIAESREVDDEIEAHLEKEIAETRAQATREPDVERRTLADVVLNRGWNLTENPSVTIPPEDLVETRASTLPAVASWARAPSIISPLGQDKRFVYSRLVTRSAGESSSVQDFRQASRTLTGTVQRNLNSTAAKATLDVSVSAVSEDLVQMAVVIPTIPNQILQSIPAFTDFLNSEGTFQISKALDNHVLAQVVAATPSFGNTGTTLVDKIRTAIGVMRAAGASPTLAVLNPTDAASLDLLADAGGYRFIGRDQGTSSPLFGLDVVERIGGGSDPLYLYDPQMLGILYVGSMRFDADPYTGFASNTTNLRVEMNVLFHVRQVGGAYRVAAT